MAKLEVITLHLHLLPLLFLSTSTATIATSLSSQNIPRTPPPLPILPIPSASQLAWQQGEMAMFFHFGPNTFTDSEWGSGHADPSVFFPTKLDSRQWVAVAAAAGFSRVVLTAKHHDGFCLWPSAYTNYSVRSSPWSSGEGDVVADLAAAAHEFGLGLGLYLSPWDRHESCYGKSLEYNEYFLGQMTELLTSAAGSNNSTATGTLTQNPGPGSSTSGFTPTHTVAGGVLGGLSPSGTAFSIARSELSLWFGFSEAMIEHWEAVKKKLILLKRLEM